MSAYAMGLWKDMAAQAGRNLGELERLRDALKAAKTPEERGELLRAFKAKHPGQAAFGGAS